MLDILMILGDARVPLILIVAGLLSVSLAIVSNFGTYIRLSSRRAWVLGTFGAVLFFFGIFLYIMPSQMTPMRAVPQHASAPRSPEAISAGEVFPRTTTTTGTDPSRVDVELPASASTFWVFLQDPNQKDPSGCTRLADDLAPRVFADRLGEFIAVARDRQAELIVTAYSDSLQQWVDSQIRLFGRPVVPMAPYWCNGNKDYGSRIPVD